MSYFGILLAIIGFLLMTISGMVICRVVKERRYDKFLDHSLEAMTVANEKKEWWMK